MRRARPRLALCAGRRAIGSAPPSPRAPPQIRRGNPWKPSPPPTPLPSFFFNDPAPPEITPLSLPDALPISVRAIDHDAQAVGRQLARQRALGEFDVAVMHAVDAAGAPEAGALRETAVDRLDRRLAQSAS